MENRKDIPGGQNANNNDAGTKAEKREVKVINTPKKKKKPLRTPSHILRITMMWCFLICVLLLTYPFLSVPLYINDNLEITSASADVSFKLATQEEIDAAAKRLQTAIDGLVEAPPEETEEASEQDSKTESDAEASKASEPVQDSDGVKTHKLSRAISTAYYDWTYNIAEGVNIDSLAALIDKGMAVDRDSYTEESIKVLNDAVLSGQRTLCATVTVTQNAWQMMVGGPVKEAFGVGSSAGETIFRTILAFALAVLPVVGFFAATFDKRRHIKHVIIMICCVVALLDLFLAIYPYVGLGAVLSIIMYVIISIINISSIYAKQQEDFIVNHPEEEAEFTVKHPQFVKALLNEKSFGSFYDHHEKREREYRAAKNAKKRNRKKKKSK